MGFTHTILLSVMLYLPILLISSKEVREKNENCNTTESERVQYEFTTDVVKSQHIITFKGYYPRSTRENYVNAALTSAGVSIQILL